MTNFKVGDRVRTKYAGEITTIVALEGFDLPYPYKLARKVKNDGNGSGRSRLAREDEIELAHFKIGDRVKLVDSHGNGDPIYQTQLIGGLATVRSSNGVFVVVKPDDLDHTQMAYPEDLELIPPKVCYLAGPMTGIDLFNFPAFEDAAEDLRARGWTVISPAEMDIEEGFTPSASGDDQAPEEYAAFLARDIEKIAEANIDAIVVLPGWEKSGGAKTEVAFCRALSKDVLAYPALDPVKDPDEPIYAYGPVSISFTRKLDDPVVPGGGTLATGEDDFYNTPQNKAVTVVGDGYYFGIENGPSKANVSDPHTKNPKDAAASNKTRLDLLEPAASAAVAGAMADGERKYGTRNYIESQISARVYYAAMHRHLDAWLSGQDCAADSGLHHLAHVGANVNILFAAMEAGTLIDDRHGR